MFASLFVFKLGNWGMEGTQSESGNKKRVVIDRLIIEMRLASATYCFIHALFFFQEDKDIHNQSNITNVHASAHIFFQPCINIHI